MWVLLPWILGGIFIWMIASETGNQVGDSMGNAIGRGIKYLFASKEKKAEIREKNEEERKRKIEWEERQRYINNPKNWISHRYSAMGETNERYRILWQKSCENWESLTKEYAPELFDYIKGANDSHRYQFGDWITHLVGIQLEPQGYYLFDLAKWDSAEEYSKETIIAGFKSKHRCSIEEFEKSGKVYG